MITRSRRHPAPMDPFRALDVQTRLSELARAITRIENTPDLYARVHHWRAYQGAYEGALHEACVLAGLDEDAADSADRFTLELELAARGWSW
ncbi:hypothetical protein Bcav_3191 [Beutenbergia cavernae DSM 12333]|uniref:Uncharacterized protein n=1 Tax=Beutenbergia cavernae (strain ATCC BAA-8 / DSM 12333 / CCUG 43141 / JCM 11478 / NBRC 16432 / NCIMB 13614 / HKI 0122) TaxID=471853 RepID=C5C0N9_BEUC1|nr:hypothetical protein [Beutenbergia cavernae]ACQ81435.1 hypothetical protein Bcav_3191 [Beutenbergia cavernae DSM 12333]